MHKSIQELQSNDDSVTDDMLILVLQKFEEGKSCVWGMMTRMIRNSIQEAKSKDGNATDEPLLFWTQKSEENQWWYLGNDDDNNEINESLYLTLFVYVCFYLQSFHHCSEDLLKYTTYTVSLNSALDEYH